MTRSVAPQPIRQNKKIDAWIFPFVLPHVPQDRYCKVVIARSLLNVTIEADKLKHPSRSRAAVPVYCGFMSSMRLALAMSANACFISPIRRKTIARSM